MKAIETKYIGPTNTKGARIVAKDSDGNRVTIGYPHELSGEAVHAAAALALCAKMGWTGELVGGGLKNGYVFVFVDASTEKYATKDQSPTHNRHGNEWGSPAALADFKRDFPNR